MKYKVKNLQVVDAIKIVDGFFSMSRSKGLMRLETETGHTGDYLVSYSDGQQHIVKGADFERDFEPDIELSIDKPKKLWIVIYKDQFTSKVPGNKDGWIRASNPNVRDIYDEEARAKYLALEETKMYQVSYRVVEFAPGEYPRNK